MMNGAGSQTKSKTYLKSRSKLYGDKKFGIMPIVVLISGRGSNLQSIIEEMDELPIEIKAVISNNPDAPGLYLAHDAGILTDALDHRQFSDRKDFDEILMEIIDKYDPGLVVLAGFMLILGSTFVKHYEGRLINIHPSLLPKFPGLDTHARALASEYEHGATVHFVTTELDAGPIIIQSSVPVLVGDTLEELTDRVLMEEHRIYPQAIGWFAEGRLEIDPNGKVLLDGTEQIQPIWSWKD